MAYSFTGTSLPETSATLQQLLGNESLRTMHAQNVEGGASCHVLSRTVCRCRRDELDDEYCNLQDIVRGVVGVNIPRTATSSGPEDVRVNAEMVVDSNVLPFIRLYSWWVLLQNWSTLRLSGDMKIKDNTLDALLSVPNPQATARTLTADQYKSKVAATWCPLSGCLWDGP